MALIDIVGLLNITVCMFRSLYSHSRKVERLVLTIQEMQSSFHESSDGSGPIGEISGSPLLSFASTNSNDSSDTPWIPPELETNIKSMYHHLSCEWVVINWE